MTFSITAWGGSRHQPRSLSTPDSQIFFGLVRGCSHRFGHVGEPLEVTTQLPRSRNVTRDIAVPVSGLGDWVLCVLPRLDFTATLADCSRVSPNKNYDPLSSWPLNRHPGPWVFAISPRGCKLTPPECFFWDFNRLFWKLSATSAAL